MAPAPETESELGSPAPTASTDSALAIQTSDTSILSWASVEVGRIALPAEPDQPSEEPVIELELSDALLDNNPDDGLEDSLDTDGVLVDILAESALVIPL
jgi:hypothetical protein